MVRSHTYWPDIMERRRCSGSMYELAKKTWRYLKNFRCVARSLSANIHEPPSDFIGPRLTCAYNLFTSNEIYSQANYGADNRHYRTLFRTVQDHLHVYWQVISEANYRSIQGLIKSELNRSTARRESPHLCAMHYHTKPSRLITF